MTQETTTPEQRKRKLEYFTDDTGEIRWRVKAKGNNHIISASSEGFKTLRAAMDNYEDSLRPVDLTVDKTKKKGKKNAGGTTSSSTGGDVTAEAQKADAQGSDSGAGGPDNGGDPTPNEDPGHGDPDPAST